MISVFYDGSRLNVRLNKKIYKQALKIAKDASYFEYEHEIGIMNLPPTKKIARELFNLGLGFDESAKIFINKIISESKLKEDNGIDFSILSPLELRNYQKEGVLWMLIYHINFLLGDEMGLGKTIQIATYLFYKQSFPALIICPASLKLNWEREIFIWTKKKCLVLEGLTPYPIEGLLKEFPVVIINYDILGRKNKLEVEYEEQRIKAAKKQGFAYKKKIIHPTGWIDVLKNIPFTHIICDECQFIGESEIARTQSVKDLCKEIKSARRIFLSGTPYTSATRQFYNVLNLIDYRLFPNEWKFKMTYCNPVKTRYGWEFRGLSHADQLHTLVSSVMLRRLKADVLNELPPKIKSVIPMKLDKSFLGDYYDAERRMLNVDVIKNEQLTYQELKYLIFYAKIDSCIQWIKEYLVIHDKLVIFIYHREAFDLIMKEFEGTIVGINGNTPVKKRQGIVDQFQKNKKIKLFCGQINAAGVGITLTAASAVAFIEFGNTASEHEQAEDRIHRISQKADRVVAYYLIGLGTIDEDIIENIKRGYADQKRILDGVINAEFIQDTPLDFIKNVLKARKMKLYNK